MKIAVAAAAGAALLLAGCGPKALTLPAQSVDRAATCAVVAAAGARSTTDIKAPLPFEAQGHVLHYPLLAASEGERFAPEIANAVSTRMSELQDAITSGKWQDLAPACRAAYPQAEIVEATLPDDHFDAQLGCDELGDFLSTAMQSQEADYGKQLSDYRAMARKLDQVLGPGLRARVGAGLEAQQALRAKTLAETVKRGSPVVIMRQCVQRFG